VSLRLALIDGPLQAGHAALGRQVFLRAAAEDSPAATHAAALAAAVLAQAPGVAIDNLVVFDGRLATDAATVAQALEAARGAALVLCAFGLPRDDPSIRLAVAACLNGGALVVASAPARGPDPYPAALPGVLAVQGDARCGPGQWSALAPGRFGACPQAGAEVRGASAAAGHCAGHLAQLILGGASGAGAAVAALEAGAAFRGPERRLA
jgi:hypothetical protein